MDNELKETLLKVADYHELEKQRAAKTGSISFCIMFPVCAAAIIVQIIMSGNLSLVAGENIILLIGGLVYIGTSVKNGSWNGTIFKNTPKKNCAISIVCAGIFSVIFYFMLKEKSDSLHAIGAAVCFFIIISIISYVILRGISFFSSKKADELKSR